MPELPNGADVHRIPNQAADEESELFVLTGEPLCLLLYLISINVFICTRTMHVDQHHCKCVSVIQEDSFNSCHLARC